MATRQWIYFLLPAAMLLLMAGCSSSNTNVQNAPPPVTKSVAIAFQPAPPASVAINTTASLTAVVTNDPSNSGVDWSVECALPVTGTSSPCGSLSASHTASGTPVTYTPPTTFPGSSLPVTILAFATAAHTQNAVAGLVVTGFTAMLKGTYVLQAQGMDSGFNPYQFAGVVILDGKGNIASGEQTLNFFDPNPSAYVSKPDAITGGSYFLGIDGRGTLNINTTDQDLGANGTELFTFVFLSSSQALITALPTSTLSIAATGTMDLQSSSVTAPSAGYAFVMSGTDTFSGAPTAFGGIFNIDSPNTISGNGSVGDQNFAGTVVDSSTVTGTVLNPDPYGAVTISLTIPLFSSGVYQFTGYIVDATHIKLIESDTGGIGSTIGLAIGQGSATGTFTDDTSFAGTYVFGVPGQDLTNSSSYFPDSATSVGVFTADGAGNFTSGISDTFLQENSLEGTAGAQISASFGGLYSVTHPGDGHVRAAFTHFSPEPIGNFTPLFFFFLTGNGNPALVLASGDINYGFLGAGIAYPQAAAPVTYGGTYGVNIVQQNGGLLNAGEGPMAATASAGTLSGLLDIDTNFLPSLDTPFTGTFAAAPDANGRSSGTFTGPFVFSPFAAEYYAIDSGHGFFVETDLTNVIAPTGVVSLGYYTPRTPACSGCP